MFNVLKFFSRIREYSFYSDFLFSRIREFFFTLISFFSRIREFSFYSDFLFFKN